MVRQRYRLIMIFAALFMAAIYFFIFSNSGLLERIRLENGKIQLQKKIEFQKAENVRLQGLLQRYKKGEYPDSDILNSGFRDKGEKFLFLRGLEKKESVAVYEDVSPPGSSPLLAYFRAGWVFLSAILLAVIYLYARRQNDADASE